MRTKTSTIEVAMTGISLDLPEDLSHSLADLAKTHGQSVSYLAMDVLRDHIKHERRPIKVHSLPMIR